MTIEEFVSVLQESDIPVTHYQWPVGEVPDLPYLVYLIPQSDCEYGDNISWAEISEINVELYSKQRNFQLEDRLKEIFNAHELPYTTEFNYIKSEKMFQTVFYLEEVFDNE